jgi:DNA-binding transcriptional MerR regulator
MAGDWLNLNEAAQLAGCSRKTLYRIMAKGALAYRKETNNRRYVRRQDIETLFAVCRTPHGRRPQTRTELAIVMRMVEQLSADLGKHSEVLERMIALYQPKSLGDLVNKLKSSQQ